MKPSRQTVPRLEALEEKKLLSAAPRASTLAARPHAVVSRNVPPLHGAINGMYQGKASTTNPNNVTETFSGSGKLRGMGIVLVTGTLHIPTPDNPISGGSLDLAGAFGTVTLGLNAMSPFPPNLTAPGTTTQRFQFITTKLEGFTRELFRAGLLDLTRNNQNADTGPGSEGGTFSIVIH